MLLGRALARAVPLEYDQLLERHRPEQRMIMVSGYVKQPLMEEDL